MLEMLQIEFYKEWNRKYGECKEEKMKIAMVPFGLSRKSIKKGEEVMRKVLFVLLFVVAALVLVSGQSYAVSGQCGGCHTMHNSQNGTSMNYNGSGTPNAVLLRGDCLGCHAQNTASNGPSSANSIPPQVLHTNATDLAGGNFDNVVANMGRGHNVAGLTSADTYNTAPGGTQTQQVTCAGGNGAVNTGCHGETTGAAGISSNMMTAMAGSHHNNAGTNSQLNVATTVANSYRFLLGVKGTEDTDWQHTVSATDHNEYFSDNPDAAGFGISKLCARCHTNFHDTAATQSAGEWIRHPTEITIGATYATNYTATYSPTVPVGRTAVAAVSGTVAATDTVVCMSCHVAHGSPYADAIRWDYANNVTGDGVGCNKCHAK